MKLKYLLILLTAIIAFSACETVTEVEEPVVVQLVVEIENEAIIPGYAPRIVYEANVLESNRPSPSTVLLDFTEFLEEGRGQLPINIIEDSFSVVAEIQGDNTYKVQTAFTAFN